ncbi:hypothetical protein FSP39_010617 [Pinctada imbricata]|uniref:DNA repair protein XRCC1 n=1 Tax=Pinctada imbricata TaxID=66713 RepID=A0AA88XGS6_PINIB|nr:hypothetical protein FSP39_010617 [Pinctada imbricata]
MPEIKPQSVVTFSATDPKFPADNLLKPEGAYKWKGPQNSPKNEVVLQLDKAYQIHSVDVGNEGSAFVEVLVGRSATPDKEYEVLLVASAFMNPLESRNGTNRNAVRMFGPDKLTKSVASEKWDRVKIVCTQPFNKSSSYGLSFITLHAPPEAGEKGGGETGVKKLGAFMLKPELDDDIKLGAAFAKKTTDSPATGAAAVRAASRLVEEKKREIMNRKEEATPEPKPSTSKAEDTPAKNNGGSKRKHAMSDEEEEEVSVTHKPPMKKQSTSLSSTASSVNVSEKPKLKKTKSEPPKECHERKFSKLMEGVVFVLSGFQNPFRGELRDKAMEMGAVYKPDWKKGCTHLICAFSNTPKYNQVNGKGKIVKKEWILHCYKQKTLLPWRKYRLGDSDSPDVTSDESEEEFVPSKKTSPKKSPSETNTKKQDEEKKSPAMTKKSKKEIDYGGDTDSGDDMEDELNRVKAKMASNDTSTKDDPYNDSTDEDEPVKKTSPKKMAGKPSSSSTNEDKANHSDDSGLPELPDYFSDKHFFLYGDFPSAERRLLTRYITAYDGEIEEYMNGKVDFVVTNSDWDDNFEDALSDHPKLVFVRPKWIHDCHDKEKLVPHQFHIVVPKD